MKRFLLVFIAYTVLLAGCATLPENANRVESRAFADTGNTALGKSLAAYRAGHPGQDAFLLLDNGLDAFVARAVLAEQAERSLDVQYYLYHDDLVGRLFTALLWRAAERGVRVRLLVDDMDMAGRDAGIITFDSHPDIEVRIFNPFSRDIGRAPQFVSGFGSLTRRMHNKSFTADNTVTVVGGRNIGNEYFAADPELAFADLDIMAGGKVARAVSDTFDEYWNSPLAYPASTLIKTRPTAQQQQALTEGMLEFAEQQRDSTYMTALRDSGLARSQRADTVDYSPGSATVVADHPDKITSARDASELQLVSRMAPLFSKLGEDLVVISPYFVPGKEGVEFFCGLTGRGVRVRILTNSLASNDVGIVHAGYARYRRPLLRCGVELFEMNSRQNGAHSPERRVIGSSSRASLHAKTFILDRSLVFVGSLNLDPRSFYENTEIGLVVDAPEITRTMTERFDSNIGKRSFRVVLEQDAGGAERLRWHGYEADEAVSYSVEPHTSLWQRVMAGLMRLLPVESQL